MTGAMQPAWPLAQLESLTQGCVAWLCGWGAELLFSELPAVPVSQAPTGLRKETDDEILSAGSWASHCCLFLSLPNWERPETQAWLCRGLGKSIPLVSVFLANAAENTYDLFLKFYKVSHMWAEKSSDQPYCTDPEASLDSSPCSFNLYHLAV